MVPKFGSAIRKSHEVQGSCRRGIRFEKRVAKHQALERLFSLVYDQLIKKAGGLLKYERTGLSLQAEDLVHEVYLRLTAQTHVGWKNKAHVLAVSTQMMQRILVDLARKFNRGKRGGELTRVWLDWNLAPSVAPASDRETLSDCLHYLAKVNQRYARIAELRYYWGMSTKEIARALGISAASVERGWRDARCCLRQRFAAIKG